MIPNKDYEVGSIKEIARVNPEKNISITGEEYNKLQEEIKEETLNPTKPKKKFILPWKQKQSLRKGNTNQMINVLLYTSKKKIDIVPTRLYNSNFFVIKNRVYRYDPSAVFDFGKFKVVSHRDYDREPITVNDYNELLLRDFASKNPGHRVNINDEPIIKAILEARLGEKQNALANNKWWILIGIAVLAIAAFFLLG